MGAFEALKDGDGAVTFVGEVDWVVDEDCRHCDRLCRWPCWFIMALDFETLKLSDFTHNQTVGKHFSLHSDVSIVKLRLFKRNKYRSCSYFSLEIAMSRFTLSNLVCESQSTQSLVQ